MKAPTRALSLAALGLFALACGKATPVARLEVQPQQLTLGYPDIQLLHLSWEPESALDPAAGTPTVFVHLLDPHGRIVRTYDHPFPGPWQEGTPVAYDVKVFQSALAAPLPPGAYTLSIGLYGNRSGQRWPLDVAAQDLKRHEYQVAKVQVPAAGHGPRFSFSGPWLASESGGSRQILARRWLDGPGVLRVQGLSGPGSLWLVIRIPAGDGPAEKLVFDGPSNAPSVVVSASCNGGVETGISGTGSHEIEIPAEGAANGSCEIHLRPNFHLRKAGLPGTRSIALENVAWTPAGAAPPSPPPDEPDSPTAPAPVN
ncbi:MAG TPA: hypothetical protein VFE33_02445 [Thermoanaerobaculia bacterium]|nr:hypothetical protein [Thermoanaerobaculia bacterium]